MTTSKSASQSHTKFVQLDKRVFVLLLQYEITGDELEENIRVSVEDSFVATCYILFGICKYESLIAKMS